MLQSKVGYIDARPLTASSTKSTCNARPDHTSGSLFGLRASQARYRRATEIGQSNSSLQKSAKQITP